MAAFSFDELRSHRTHIRIVHHIRGRIRLKLEAIPEIISLPAIKEQQFRGLVDQTPGLLSLRVNLMARSCIVEYDPALIPYQAWHDFIDGRDSSSAAHLEYILRDIYREIIHAEL